MQKIGQTFFLAILIFFSKNALSIDDFESVTKSFRWLGALIEVQTLDKVTEINLRLDENQFLASIPKLEELGILMPDVPEKKINVMPVIYAEGMARMIAASVLLHIYKDNTINQVKFNCYFLTPNDYGDVEEKLMSSFFFNREIYNKIDWSNFNAKNLDKVALKYRLTDWFNRNSESEILELKDLQETGI